MPAAPARRRILDAARTRFAAGGVLATTLDDVRSAAGASVGAVYHHFPDKQALVDAVRADVRAEYEDAFVAALERHTSAEDGVRGAVAFHLAWCAAHPEAATLLLEGHRATAADADHGELLARVRAWWRPHVHYGALRDLDPVLALALWLGPATAFTRHTVRKPTKAAATTLADAAWAVLRAPEPSR